MREKDEDEKKENKKSSHNPEREPLLQINDNLESFDDYYEEESTVTNNTKYLLDETKLVPIKENPKESEIIHIKTITEKEKKSKKKVDFRDILLLNDLDLFYKSGQIPFILFFHILCTSINTFLIVTQIQNLNKLMQQTRAVESAFYLHEDTSTPTYEFARKYYYTDLNSFSESLIDVINTIYDINNTLSFDIYFENINELKINPKFKRNSFNYQTNQDDEIKYPYSFDINEKDKDPIREYFHGNNKEIKNFISKTDELAISLNYKYKRLDYGNCQYVTINLVYDTSRISYVKFQPFFEFDDCEFDLQPIRHIFHNSYLYFSLVLFIGSIAEIFFILYKILKIMQIVLYIKDNLSQTDLFNDYSNEKLFLYTGESKWDLVKNQDIFGLFPLSLFLFLIAGILNALGGIYFIFIPFLNGLNRILFGFGSFFSWIAFSHYFKSNPKYNVFYNTLYKSLKEYKYLFTTFVLLLTGFCLLNLCVYCHSDQYYDGFQGTFFTIFCASLGDDLLYKWYPTFDEKPVITLIFAFIIFLCFLGNHINVMFIVTTESFQLANLETKKSWLDNKFDFSDYLNQQFNIMQEDDEEEEKKEQNENKNDFAIDDHWMRAILNLTDKKKLENLNLNNLKAKGVNGEAVMKYFKKIIKKKKIKELSKGVIKEILSEKRNTEIEKLNSKDKQIERAFNYIEDMFYNIYLQSKEEDNIKEEFKIKIREICQQNLEEINEIKKSLV